MFVGYRTVFRQGLRHMQGIDVVHRHFGGNVGTNGTKRKRRGVNHHLSVERGIERIAGTEINSDKRRRFGTDGVLFNEVITIIQVTAACQRREESMPHQADRVGVEIEVAFATQERRIVCR